jgi:hypothetical protein
MLKKAMYFIISVCFVFSFSVLNAQEIPIAVGNDTTIAGGAAFDGINMMMAILGDEQGKENISGQLVSTINPVLVGNRISLGQKGGIPKVAFDGTNYLFVWHEIYEPPFAGNIPEINGKLMGQFVSAAGTLVGSVFTVATDVSSHCRQFTLSFNNDAYFITFGTGNDEQDIPYNLIGVRLDKSGNFIGSQILISNINPRETAIDFDGSNYLVAWVKDIDDTVNSSESDVYGQFISASGELIGSNFIIDTEFTTAIIRFQ